jgi:hypothetical protein
MRAKLKSYLKSVNQYWNLSGSKLKGKHFDSIENLPIYNWWKVHQSGDLGYLLIFKRAITLPEAEELKKVWTAIYNEYIAKFGFGEVFMQIHEKKRKIAKLKLDKIVNDKKYLQTIIDVEEVQIEDLKKQVGKGDFYQNKAYLERALNMRIDPRVTSVIEYYSYTKILAK